MITRRKVKRAAAKGVTHYEGSLIVTVAIGIFLYLLAFAPWILLAFAGISILAILVKMWINNTFGFKEY